MAQLGGKDLRDLKDLPRNPVGSYGRSAVDPRRPSLPVLEGQRAPLLERYPSLRLYDPRAWADWFKSYARNRVGVRHPFNSYVGDDRGIYSLTGAGGGGAPVRMALAGDWGSGTDEARRVAVEMARTTPDFTIHLGDIYYVGSLEEVNEHFLGVDNPHNDYTPCTWPLGAVGSFALNGNHEMYALGHAYFELLLPQLGLWHPRIRQSASFFCLENEHWRVIAIDTAYNSLGWPLVERWFQPDCQLPDELMTWLGEDLRLDDPADRRGLVLLSHHQYFSAFDDWYPRPAQQLARFIRRPVLWFWGHEHRLALYACHAFEGGIEAYGRCVGHGGMPVDLPARGEFPRHPECPPTFADNRRFANDEGLDVGYNGFASLVFDGPRLAVDYVDVDGDSIWKEAWMVEPTGELRG
jgi:Calcineurin-like phosphoesterase